MRHMLRLKALGPWLAEMWHVWLALAVTGIALAVSLRPPVQEPTVRLTGLVLQVLGIGTVAWGISETRRLYGHKPLFTVAANWVKRFPLFNRTYVGRVANAESATAADSVRGYMTHGTPQGASVEEQLEAVRKNIHALHSRIDAAQSESGRQVSLVRESVERETAERVRSDAETRSLLESTATGGVHISAIGALWLFVGVVLSTAGLEITAMLTK